MVRCLVAGVALTGASRSLAELRAAGFELQEVTTGAAALARVDDWCPHVALLWGSYPDATKPALVRAIRSRSWVPILVLDERIPPAMRLELFTAGADDVITLPVAPGELVVRIRSRFALIERLRSVNVSNGHKLRVGVLELDPQAREARCDGRELSLTPVEFRLLQFLMYNQGKAVSRSLVLDAVWGEDVFPESNVVDRKVFALRRKLAPEAAHYIETVPRTGYRLRSDPLHDLAQTLRVVPTT